uniref:Histone-lysine N-methyltransferase n=1 Tax=Panagrolaimus superbus TaxID=310955 RepID=A0A914Y5C7_9BILA
MKRGRKRHFNSSGPSSSSTSKRTAAPPTKKGTLAKQQNIQKTPEILAFEQLLENITLKDSTEAFLPLTLEPIRVDNDEEQISDDQIEVSSDTSELMMPMLEDCESQDDFMEDEEEKVEFEVERILLKRNDTHFYFVKWFGYKLSQGTWEPLWNLTDCDRVLNAFEDRKMLCFKIYQSLPNKDEYKGFLDTWINGIITTTFIETCVLEDIFTKFCKNNKLANLCVENWTRSIESYPKISFISENTFSDEAKQLLETIDPPKILCSCVACGKKSEDNPCPCIKAAATSNGFIRSLKKTQFVMECNKSCDCSEKCLGKVFGRGRTTALILFRTHWCGWGIRTLVDIPRSKFVDEYVGRIKLHHECRNIKDPTYLFDIDSDDGETVFVVDATEEGNASRFINHSCDPNLEVVLVKGLHNHKDFARVTFFSVREIQAGEELTFNYFKHKLDLSLVDKTTPKCYCGYELCRKYLI